MIILIIAIIAIIITIVLYNKYKIPKSGNMVLITGGIKTGKTMLGVYLAIKTIKANKIKAKIKRILQKLLPKSKRKEIEEPYLYSNIPLSCEYVPLTEELLLRKERFTYGSVAYVCEASLVANSMDYKDNFINDNMLLLNKLFAHETKGGKIIYDTQSISDNHYAVKRCLSTYFYIHHSRRIPFFVVMHLQELKYSDDNQTIQTYNKDIEDEVDKIVLVPKSIWYKYDRYCYSVLTDNLPINKQVVKKRKSNKYKQPRMKADRIITFHKSNYNRGDNT